MEAPISARRGSVPDHAALLRLAHDDAARAAKGQGGSRAAQEARVDVGSSEQPFAGRALKSIQKRVRTLAFLVARSDSMGSSKSITVVFIVVGFLQVSFAAG